MGKIYRQEHTIPFYEADVTSKVKLSHLVNKSLEVSGWQAHSLGWSDQRVLDEYGLIWVVTDYQFTIERLPVFAENIIIETEAVSYNKLFCYREFRIFDANDQLLVSLLCSFVLMDAQTRKVHAVIDEVVAPFGADKIKAIRRGEKMAELTDPVVTDRQVTYFDLDMNGHVNNSKYIDWFIESLGREFLNEHIPKRLTIKYSKEVHYGKNVQVASQLTNLTSRHDLLTEDGLSTQAVIEWEKVDD
ncbi:medium-chain acyl-[acyl-carrier-protein] hydrolase [Streptococcus rupicaprae]|uniref:Medium-chain acyl-[acyl-carrier-protein] hydrolase n=1 Tax=Streptococcus rupicaprae TaxID=759619 RepID=A0ABV2FFE9_9STRE